VLVGFVLGGFLGAVLPLRSSESARAARAVIFLVATAMLLISGFPYGSALFPRSTAEQRPAPVKGPPLVEQDDATLGLVYGIPVHLSRTSSKADKEAKQTIYTPTFKSLPQIHVRVIPRGDYFSPDGRALQLADMERQQDPTAKLTSEGSLECSLGPAYHVALVVSHEANEYATWHCFVSPKGADTMIWVQLFAEPDDEDARPMLEAVVRSLKLRAGQADK
jgi:hypothetical protein